jgi:hypothetical protein
MSDRESELNRVVHMGTISADFELSKLPVDATAAQRTETAVRAALHALEANGLIAFNWRPQASYTVSPQPVPGSASASERLQQIQRQLTDGQNTGNMNLVYASISNLIREVARLYMVTAALAGEGAGEPRDLESRPERRLVGVESVKLFWLSRSEDVTGVSGTGVVAEGVLFEDGSAVVRWLTEPFRSLVIWPAPNALEAIKAVHGHDGRTGIIWL